ncbi:protein transport protein Sec24C-like [Eurosta solidaginis]|uniref:protein transport protein Sec24C-like n=2 Tax=Eurosta solidaginis TaxID=178769 RepID=UPI003530A254
MKFKIHQGNFLTYRTIAANFTQKAQNKTKENKSFVIIYILCCIMPQQPGYPPQPGPPGYPPQPQQPGYPLQQPGAPGGYMGQIMPPTQPGQARMPRQPPMPGQPPIPRRPGDKQPPAPGTGIYQQPQQYNEAQRHLDPDQMPNPISVIFENQNGAGCAFITNQQGLLPPLVTTKYVIEDQGNSSPRYVRSSLYCILATADLLKTTALSFTLTISPMPRTVEGEYEPLMSNINASQSIVDAVCTTLGPRSMDKHIVDYSGKATISNDGANIMKLLDIQP